ncbi:MAG: hypothetical protein CL772_05870 [Chloroflexi bacterium]|nr:hypothetical protein [Chloroflexota bacterium]|tara:strand:- start:68547 stop:68948 length:402 start_codon:yes stop_codon:yes gene_type:complete
MSIYNVALSLILIFANWLFISSYLNIYKFFDYERNNNIPNNILVINIFTFIFIFISYLLPNIFFQFNSIKSYEFLPYFFLMLLTFWILIIYGIYLYIFEKISIRHIFLLVLITIINIGFTYPTLLSLAFDKYE